MNKGKEVDLKQLQAMVDGYANDEDTDLQGFIRNVFSDLYIWQQDEKLESITTEQWQDFDIYVGTILANTFKSDLSLEETVSNIPDMKMNNDWNWYQDLTGARASARV